MTATHPTNDGTGSFGIRLARRYELLSATVAIVAVLVWMTGGSVTGTLPGGLDLAGPSGPLVVSPANGAALPPAPTAAPGATRSPLPPLPLDPATSGGAAPTEPASAPPTTLAVPTGSSSYGTTVAFANLPDGQRVAGVAATEAGDVWATAQSQTGPTLHHFGADGALLQSVPLPDVASAHGITIGPDRRLYVLTGQPAQVLAITTETGQVDRYAVIPDAPSCIPLVLTTNCDGSITNSAPMLSDLTFDGGGRLYVTDTGQAAIWRVGPADRAVTQVLVDPSWSNPVRPAGPTGISVAGDTLLVAVQGTLDSDAGRVVAVELTPDGVLGARTDLASTDPGSLPAEIEVGETGRIYVALAGTGHVLVLQQDGAEFARVPPPNAEALNSPTSLTLRDRSLLVGCLGSSDDVSRVVRVDVDDSPRS
jgi:sugar lactone lactonase YvrE